jgi:hypothetical protein
MFRIVCDSSSGSIELYLTEIIRSGSQKFVLCLVGVWQRNFETVVCVCGRTFSGLSVLLTNRNLWTSIEANTIHGCADSKSKEALCVILASLIFLSPTVHSRSALCVVYHCQGLQFIWPRILMKLIHST